MIEHDPLCTLPKGFGGCICRELEVVRMARAAGLHDGFEQGQRDMLAKVFANPACVWGEGECVPDCPSCRRLDELIGERAAGYKEAIQDCIAAVKAQPVATCDGYWVYIRRNETLTALRALGGSDE